MSIEFKGSSTSNRPICYTYYAFLGTMKGEANCFSGFKRDNSIISGNGILRGGNTFFQKKFFPQKKMILITCLIFIPTTIYWTVVILCIN